MSDRRGMGLAIAKSSAISENEDGSFSVPSQSRKGVLYTVKVIGDAWTCTCPDFVNRVGRIDECKHVFAVKFWTAAQVELREQPRPKVFSEDSVQCPKCGSIRVVRFGTYNGKQVFKCKDCRSKFHEGLLKRSKYSPETITLTLDLYFSGLSSRKVARMVSDHYGVSLGQSTVHRWIARFVPKISEYVNSLTPQLSDTWHADEVFVDMRHGFPQHVGRGKAVKHIAFLWNVMDRKTRFLLASKVSAFRNAVGGERAFREAIANAHNSRPEKVITDAHYAYRDAIQFAFKDGQPQHIAKAGIRKTHANNNRIERLNGTIRERTKVQRGWKTLSTPIAEGQRIHYNFVKPHRALEGQTPAEAAGIGIEGQNRWMELLKNSIGSKSPKPPES